jgi:hypothetical protein
MENRPHGSILAISSDWMISRIGPIRPTEDPAGAETEKALKEDWQH